MREWIKFFMTWTLKEKVSGKKVKILTIKSNISISTNQILILV